MPAESTCELVGDMLGSTVRHGAGSRLYKVKCSHSHPHRRLLTSQGANNELVDLTMLPRELLPGQQPNLVSDPNRTAQHG